MPTSWRQTQSESNPSRGRAALANSSAAAALPQHGAVQPGPRGRRRRRPGRAAAACSAGAGQPRPGRVAPGRRKLPRVSGSAGSGGLVTVTVRCQPLSRGPPRRSLPVGLARTGLPTPKAWAAAASSRGPGRGSTVKVTLRVLAGPPRSRCAESSKSPLPRAESRVVTGARAAAGAGPGDRGRQCTHRA